MATIEKLHRISFNQADWAPYIDGVINFYDVVIARLETKLASEGFTKDEGLSSTTSYIYTQSSESIIEHVKLTLTIDSSSSIKKSVTLGFKLRNYSSYISADILGPWVVDYAINVFRLTRSGSPFETSGSYTYIKWSNINTGELVESVTNSISVARFPENRTYLYAMPYIVVNGSNNSQYLKNALVIDSNTYFTNSYGNMPLYDIYELDSVKYRPIVVGGQYIVLYPLFVQ